jgi:hypothetical protein
MFNIKFEEDAQNRRVMLQLQKMPGMAIKAVKMGFFRIGKDLVQEAKSLINKKPKHGRTYLKHVGAGGKKLKSAIKHIASAPGEAPAVMTGKLRDSINFTVNGSGGEMDFGVDESRNGVKYGEFLEYENLIARTGQGSKKMLPRPYISKAYENRKGKIEQIFLDEFKKYI